MQLKLYAMHQKYTAPIDNTYNGRSYNIETLKNWYESNTRTDNYYTCVGFANNFSNLRDDLHIFIFLAASRIDSPNPPLHPPSSSAGNTSTCIYVLLLDSQMQIPLRQPVVMIRNIYSMQPETHTEL